jgi:Methyltransferase domain
LIVSGSPLERPEDSSRETGIYADGTYLAKNPDWHRGRSAWKASYFARVWEDFALDPSVVCEVGCGAGEILHALAARFPTSRFVGYEISPDAFALCEPSERVEFRLEDFVSSSECFDLVLLADVIEHVEDYLGFLRVIRERSQWAMMLIPLDISAQTVLRPGRMTSLRDSVGHLHFFTKEIALDALTSIGYDIVSWQYIPAALEAPGLPLRARVVRWPRRMAATVNANFAANLLGGFSLLVLAR